MVYAICIHSIYNPIKYQVASKMYFIQIYFNNKSTVISTRPKTDFSIEICADLDTVGTDEKKNIKFDAS